MNKTSENQILKITIVTDYLCFLTDPFYKQRIRIEKCLIRFKYSLASSGKKKSAFMCYYAESVLLAALPVIFKEISERLQMLILSLVDMSAIDLLAR